MEKVFLFKKCFYICTIIINQNKNQTMKNSLTTSQINFMIEAAIIICNITREEAILKVEKEIKAKKYSISLT